jgi:colanic acid biosynthesis glycosyl transferase WcaI
VYRVRVPSGDRSNLWHRASTFAAFQAIAASLVLRIPGDVAIVTNPAIESGLPFAALRSVRRLPVVFCVWDLYPDVGQKTGVFRNSLAVKSVGLLEDFCLTRTAAVQVLTDEMADALASRGIERERIVTVPVWVDTDSLGVGPRNNALSRELGLDGSFVVLYAGNIGASQGLQVVLRAAAELRVPEIQFLIVGDGSARQPLQAEAARMGLTNVRFLPFQPRERLQELLASCDVGLVSLDPSVTSESIPSKTFTLLASGRPVIASVAATSSVARLIRDANAGVITTPGSGIELAQAIQRMFETPERRTAHGAAGRQWVVAKHGRLEAARKFEQVLSSLEQ